MSISNEQFDAVLKTAIAAQANLHARITELEKDRTRMDWLESRIVIIKSPYNSHRSISIPGDGSGYQCGTLRDGIDAAMSEIKHLAEGYQP